MLIVNKQLFVLISYSQAGYETFSTTNRLNYLFYVSIVEITVYFKNTLFFPQLK